MWDDECRWPRRLLHVESLTSYTWQPGNKYHGYANPTYNAITYTWGRFQLNAGEPEYTTTEPLPIKGTTWPQYLPKIRPSHFTVDELLHIIKTAVRPCQDYPSIKFVWLDVACINQTPDSEEYYSEIGRQAKIFQGAFDVFAWFTSLNTRDMASWASDMRCLTARDDIPKYIDDKSHFQTWVKRASQIVKRFTDDRWFSSLWTLQESFLCPHAIILARDGISDETVQWLDGISPDDGPHVGHLHEFITTCHRLKGSLKWFKNAREQDQSLQILEGEVEKIGFLDGVCEEFEWDFAQEKPNLPFGEMGNPFALLKASYGRSAWVAADRVYGIMQVFNLRLGKTVPGCEKQNFTVRELEDQLGDSLLKKYPISSQLIVQNKDCPPNRAWRMCQESSLPNFAYEFWRHSAHFKKSKSSGAVDTSGLGADLRTERCGEEILGAFSGHITRVENFVAVLGVELDGKVITCTLDQRWICEIGEAGQMSLTTNKIPARTQLEWLQRRFEKPVILFLGRIQPPEGGFSHFDDYVKFRDWGIGLLLGPLKDVHGQYLRLGTIIWDFGPLTYENLISDSLAEYLDSAGNGWQKVSDQLFG